MLSNYFDLNLSDKNFKQIASLLGSLQEIDTKKVVLNLNCTESFLVSCIASWLANKDVVVPSLVLDNNTKHSFDYNFDFYFLNQQAYDANSEVENNREKFEVKIPKDSKIIFFTSGTTGQPKPVEKCFDNIYSEVKELERVFGSKVNGLKYYSTVSHNHMYGFLFKLMWPLFTGKLLSWNTLKYPESLLNIKEDYLLVTTPGFLERIYFIDKPLENKCKFVFTSGGKLYPPQAENCLDYLNVHPMEIFGSTETGGIAFRSSGSTEKHWSLFSGVEISSQDKQVVIKSSFFVENTLFLQDSIEVLNDNKILLGGRKDKILKIEEKRVSIIELEKKIEEFSLVESVKILPIKIDNRLKVGAVVILNPMGARRLQEQGKLQLDNEIKKFLKGKVEGVTRPKKIRYVKQYPENSMGKVTQKLLGELFE